MITTMEKNQIIIKYKNGESIRKISKDLKISRNTVRTYLRNVNGIFEKLNKEFDATKIAALQKELCSPPVRKITNKKRQAFNKDVEIRFNEIIKISEERDKILGPNKQRLTAAKIFSILKDENYKVSLSTISNEYRKYKNKHRECFIRQEYDYGYRVEFDFHMIKLQINGEAKKYHQVTIVAPKSNHIFELLYDNEKKNVVIESIIKYINYCGGVFNEFVFDNMKTVVKQFYKNNKEYTNEIISLSTYYGFKIFTCNPRSGNEKGSVENGGKYTRNDIFSLRYTFNSEEELMNYHQQELEKINKRYEDEWQKEKTYLKAKPKADYIIQTISNNIVNSYGCVCVDNNYYSVPDKYVGETVEVSVFNDKLVIYYKGNEIASHSKIKGFHEYKIILDHYLDTFMKKPAALEHSVALKQAPEELRNIFKNNYNMNSKMFIQDLYNNQLKIAKKQYETTDEIEKASISQIEEINNIFGGKNVK